MPTQRAKKTARRRSWGTLRVMRNGRVQASYIYDATDAGTTQPIPTTTAPMPKGWLANERN